MVFVPFISTPRRNLEKRKGGGGGGRGGGGGARGGSAGAEGGGGGGRAAPISAGGGSKSASSSGRGGGPVSSIPAGQPFAGRTQGGGTRDQVFGSRQYGSGYPSVSGRGVAGRGFPFFFWPVVWGGAVGVGGGAYLHSQEYGSVGNTSRPGGALFTATLPSGSSNTTFRLLSDNSTVSSLLVDITTSCGSSLPSNVTITPSPYNDTGPPVPEQAVQYYRASSVALTLDGYNNTAVFSSDDNAPDVPLPNNIDTTLLNCLNTTIGSAVPLVDGAYGMRWSSPSNLGLFVLVWIISKLAAEA